jgi:hypothetical protein
MVVTTDQIIFALVLLSILYFVFVTRLTSLLRVRHVETWTTLGEPGFLNYSIRNSNRLALWVLFRSDYRSLQDDSVGRSVWILRVIAIVQLGLLAILLGRHYGFF